MSDYALTAKGVTKQDWYDRNLHMNVVHYLALFDEASFKIAEVIGMDEAFNNKFNITLVAAKMFTTHKKEMLAGENYEIHTGIIDFDTNQITLTHRMKRDGVLVAVCDMLMRPIDFKTRMGTVIPGSILKNCHQFQIHGLRNVFKEIG